MLRPSALTTPVETVDCNPNGLPIAITTQNVAAGQRYVAVEHLRIPRTRDQPIVLDGAQRRLGRGIRRREDIVSMHEVVP
jgi:hypothetical protein